MAPLGTDRARHRELARACRRGPFDHLDDPRTALQLRDSVTRRTLPLGPCRPAVLPTLHPQRPRVPGDSSLTDTPPAATPRNRTQRHTPGTGAVHPERRKDRDGLARYRRVLHITKWRKRLTKIAITDDVKSSQGERDTDELDSPLRDIAPDRHSRARAHCTSLARCD